MGAHLPPLLLLLACQPLPLPLLAWLPPLPPLPPLLLAMTWPLHSPAMTWLLHSPRLAPVLPWVVRACLRAWSPSGCRDGAQELGHAWQERVMRCCHVGGKGRVWSRSGQCWGQL